MYANLGTTRSVRVPKAAFDAKQVCTLDDECTWIANRTVSINQALVLLVP